LRIVGVTSSKRSPELPDIPSIAETVPGYDASLWTGLLAPRGTPAIAIKRIHSEVTKLLQTDEVKAAYSRVGTYVVGTTPAEFREYVKAESSKWGKVVRDINLQIN
jgi:tripartite-type tricarboxylate transporter receptor subunit TctC